MSKDFCRISEWSALFRLGAKIQSLVLLAAKQKDAPPTVKPRDVPPATRQKGEPVVAKQNVELLGALKELQESLMFANENPACGINGTIWMLRGNKTLFDFIY